MTGLQTAVASGQGATEIGNSDCSDNVRTCVSSPMLNACPAHVNIIDLILLNNITQRLLQVMKQIPYVV
jgi:hypothetical protein